MTAEEFLVKRYCNLEDENERLKKELDSRNSELSKFKEFLNIMKKYAKEDDTSVHVFVLKKMGEKNEAEFLSEFLFGEEE